MKKIYTLLAGIAFGFMAPALHASGGPDAYGYTWTETSDPGGPTFNWIDITARPGVQTVTGLADDNSAPGIVNLGFSFHYYWNDVTQMRVGSNGWLSFNTSVSNIASCFPTIPSAGGPADNYLAPLMGDLNFTGAGNPGTVKYWSNNVDTFIISYINVPFWSVSAPGWVGSNSFQVILAASDSSITYQYGALSGFQNNGACVDLTVGIENSTGSIGLQRYSDVMPANNYVVHFDYPSVVLLSIQDALPAWNNNSSNAAEFIYINNAFNVRTDIRNAGNTAITTFIAVQSTIQDAASTTVFSGSGTIPTLAAGDDSVYTYTNQWTPAATGQYSFQTVISNSQDINAANNDRTTELDVVNPCLPTMTLSYNTNGASTNSINWNGGANDDGVAVYFAPPVYPYTISTLQYYIATPGTNGFIAQIYDDNGPNSSAGTLLFTTNVTTGITTGWNTVNVSTPVTLTGGGFYVVWLQMGTTIFLGTETAGPRSHHNFEILDGSWATFRYDDTQDAMIRCAINGYPTTVTAASSITANQLTITASNMSTGLISGIEWDFGDNTTSTVPNTTHTYTTAGTYNVCLIVSNLCDADTLCTSITVCNTPTAGYMFNTAALTANFMDMSTGTVGSYAWDFGDAGTSTQQNPTHTYAIGGTYNVCLIVTNACGESDTICQPVSVCGTNAASYSATGNALNVTFGDLSTGAIDNWSWDFGDAGTSTQQSPAHMYATAGTYTVCLIVSNLCGNSDTTCQTVTVCDANVAGFTYTSIEDSITVSNTSTGTITSWMWDFGDGNFDNTQNPGTHHYATGGIYTVCLITTDACGVSDTFCTQDTILITGMNMNGAGINTVYPNPVSSVLSIEFAHDGNSVIEIYDAMGQVVLATKTSGSRVAIDVHELAAGLYTIRVSNSSGTSTQRFVKE